MKWRIYSYHQFNEVATQWDSLNRASLNQPILESDFIKVCMECFATDNQVIALCEDAQGPLAIGVFTQIGPAHYVTFQPSQAPLGLFLVRHNLLTDDIMRSLAKALPGVVLFIDLLQQDSQFIECDCPDKIISTPYIVTGRLALSSNFDSFFASLGKNMRQNHNKVINRCQKQAITLQAQCLTSADDVVDSINTFGDFESNGWKGNSGTAVSIENQQGQFYIALLKHYANKQQAEIWHYKADGQTIAIDLCIKSNTTLIILKTAYNEEFKKLSPALQLKFDILKHHFQSPNNQGINSVEFFGKAMEWHKRFNSELREIKHFSYFTQPLLLKLYRLVKPQKQPQC